VPVVLLLCFVISGASSLVLEVVWSRQLQNVFGSSSLAISTVLATFMGGLALGSWIGGKLADRYRQHALLIYAGCEAGIALLALLIPVALGAYPAANAWLWTHFHDHQILLALCRFGLCALLLLPPTTLMGATLPVLSRHVVRAEAELAQLGLRVGALYAANTLGAVVGAGGAGFYLLPLFGQRASYHVAVVADLVLAALIVAAVTWRRRRPAPADALDPEAEALPTPGVAEVPPPELPRGARRVVLWAVATSGAIAMALEVLWSRALALVIGSSIYSFTLVLVVFLLGLSAGATWIGRPAARARNPLAALAITYLGVGASVVLTHQVIERLPLLFIELIEGTRLGVSTIMGLQTLCAALAVAPTAACLGAVMPLTMRAYAGSVDAVGRDVGRAYAANTVGAILGSFAGGFIILPLIGLERGVRVCALAMLGLAAAMAVASAAPRLKRVGPWVAAALAAVMLLLPRWDVGVMTAGVFRITVAKRYAQRGRIPRADVVFYADGIATTVSVERYQMDDGPRYALKNNGKVEASSVGDMPTQVLVGLLPVLAHGGREQKVAVVGYGSGITVGSIAESPQVARVDVIELEPAVLAAADAWFGPYNHDVYRNPKVRRWIGDGRNFLTAYPEKYDVIVSEPSNPWIAGVSSLFTREFYAFAKQHLAEDGIYCQWAQLYELGPRHVKSIYATFHEAFPYVYAFSSGDLSADTILVGSMKPLAINVPTWERLASEPATRAELARGGVDTPLELVALLIMGPDEVPAFAAGARINTDDNGLLEYGAPRDLLAAGRSTVRFADGIYAWGWPYGHLDGVLTGLGEGAERARREADLATALVMKGKRREARHWMERARADGADVRELELLWRAAREREWNDPEVPLDAGGVPLPRPDASWFDPERPLADREDAARRLAQLDNLMAAGKSEEALRMLGGLPPPAPGPAGWDLVAVKGAALYRLLDFVAARRELGRVIDDPGAVARRPAIVYYYGRVLYGDGEFEAGARHLAMFVRRWPELVPP
jgi:spermidine synthase